MLDHGGNLDVALTRFGGCLDDWIDLSTGVNRRAYSAGDLQSRHWSALPSRSEIEALHEAARQAYATTAPLVATAGAQAAIQLLPRLAPPGRARILSPTYNEYGAVLRATGWTVEEPTGLEALAGADLAIVVNPNNPDGQQHDPAKLLALLPRVGRLIVDESFVDPVPGLSLAAEAGRPGLIVLRSFGKFYGLAGLRLGFVLGHAAEVAAFAGMLGPWPISGAAIEIGRRALADRDWAKATIARLTREAPRLDHLATEAGWTVVGGTPLFRLYETGDARAVQAQLATAKIWSRMFQDRSGWLRLALPGSEAEWARVSAALAC
jgi:cobalamin biosynthesis protein CobC